MDPFTIASLGVQAVSTASSIFGGLFGGNKTPKRVIPAPFTERYIPSSMLSKIFQRDFEPEHFVDNTTWNTMRVNNKGEYVPTGKLNEADIAKVKSWMGENMPGSEEADLKAADAANKAAQDVAKRRGQSSTILTSPEGILDTQQSNTPRLLG